MANLLVKPISEKNGNLVILADNTDEVFLVDVTTGEVIEQGVNYGPSNGRQSTVRFSRPGSVYKNVGVMDDKGNILLTMPDAGDRVQFNYQDYDSLIAQPVSTIPGYRWDNSSNIQSMQSGGPNNANIASMSQDEYYQYLDSQKEATTAQSGASGLGTIAAVAPAAYLAYDNYDEIAQGVSDLTEGGADLIDEAFGGSEIASDPSAFTAPYQMDGGEVVDGASLDASGAGEGIGLSDVGEYAGYALEAYNAYNTLTGKGSDEEKGRQLSKQAALAVADSLTGGLASIGYAAVSQIPGFAEVEEKGMDASPFFQTGGSAGKVIGGSGKTSDYVNLATGGMSGIADDVFGFSPFGSGKSTDEYKAERQGAVAKNNPIWAEEFLKSKKRDGGKYYTEGDYKGQQYSLKSEEAQARADGDFGRLNGAIGNAEAFGDRWHKISLEKRYEFMDKALEQGLYKEDKGSVVFGKNEDKAKKLMDDVLGFDFSTATDEQLNSAQAESYRPAVIAGQAIAADKDALFSAGASPAGSGGSTVPRSSAVTDLQVTDGYNAYAAAQEEAAAAAEEAQRRSMALSLIQNSPSAQMEGQLLAQAFQPEQRGNVASNFEQLAGAFR